MNSQIKLILIGVTAFSITSCTTDTNEYPIYPAYTYDTTLPYSFNNNYETINYYKYPQSREVVVPETYHMGDLRAPVSFKDRDQHWVSSQNPQSYTIQLTEGDKAFKVAQVLYKAPKNDRMAQVKYERDGKTYYKGVYGTYNSAAEAQKALNSLPPEIKGSASITNWSNVQQ